MNNGFFTRKQAWRRCKCSLKYFKSDEENYIPTNNNLIKNESKEKKSNNNKILRFNNHVYVTLIPTRKELDALRFYYDSHLNFNDNN